MGQKWLGENCFNLLNKELDNEFQLCGVISNQTEDVWWRSNKIFTFCVANNIPFVSNNRRNNEKILNLIKKLNINMIISVQHPWILPHNILSTVEFNAFNLHNAKLPEYQGNNSCNHAILNGEKTYTSTIHWMTENVDDGVIAFEKTINILPDDTARSLYQRSIISGGKIFQKLLYFLKNNKTIPKKKIVGTRRYYARNSIEEFRKIKNIFDWMEVDRKSRALYFPPFKPAFYSIQGKRFFVLPKKFREFIREY